MRAHIVARPIETAALAARHRITPRYLQMLFNRESTTLSEFVMMERLTAAHRLLGDPRHRARTISDIALAVGFGDISYFNRMFRRHFGKAPSDLRALPKSQIRAGGDG